MIFGALGELVIGEIPFETYKVVVVPASVQFGGQDVAFSVAHAVDPAAVNATGQSVPLDRSLPVTAATVQFAGQSLTFEIRHALTNAVVDFAGQVVGLQVSFAIEPAGIDIAGQELAFTSALAIGNATISVAGQAVTLRLLEPSSTRAALLLGSRNGRPRSYWRGRT